MDLTKEQEVLLALDGLESWFGRSVDRLECLSISRHQGSECIMVREGYFIISCEGHIEIHKALGWEKYE